MSGQSRACPLRGGGFHPRERVSPSLKPKLGRKKTHKNPTHSHNQNQTGPFPGAAGLHASPAPPPPALLWEAGWEPERREDWRPTPGPAWMGPQPGYKTCLALQSLLKRKARRVAMGQCPSTFQGPPVSVAGVTLSRAGRQGLSCGQGAGSGSSGQGMMPTIPHCPEAPRWAGAGTWLARAVRVQLAGSDQGD